MNNYRPLHIYMMCGGRFYVEKIKGPVITICIMHLTALLCLIILSIVQCFVDMAEWIKFALAMAVNIVVGLVCGFLLKCCFHRRRFIRVTVVAYWITYVIATVVIDIGESKNIFELLIILLLVMFSALVFR